MKGQKKKQNGITLIALVISIIVMLILAGVSINALMGDNGILRQAQYASFMSEMAAVEEAVQLWGADHYDDENHSIPANGIVPTTEIDNSERLGGEVGYYRTWSTTSIMPQPSEVILSTASDFNSKYSGELVYFPGGVEDLYYLDNDGLNLNSNKKYIIDAVNSMIYSIQGISLNGVRCYSLEMAKAIMNGTYDAPTFASAEVSGSQSNGGKKAAGNNEPQYIEDEDGNLVENPNYNPNGFQIIADSSNDNIYKLYNNGDLYAKGVKGYLMNSTQEEMDAIDSTIWNKFIIPSEIPGASTNNLQIIPGFSTMYIIDSDGYLWAWGSNSNNKLGLSQDERVEYTGMVPTKLDVDGKKVYKVFPTGMSTYVVTITNGTYELYACGYNGYGQLGTGIVEDTPDKFKKVDIVTPEKIINITAQGGKDSYDLILMEGTPKNKIYFCGATSTGPSTLSSLFSNTSLANTLVTKYMEIFNGTYGNVLSYNVSNLYRGCDWNVTRINLLADDGKLYRLVSGGTISEVQINDSSLNVLQFETASVEDCLVKINNGGNIEFYCNRIGSGSNIFGDVASDTSWKCVNSYFPTGFDVTKVKDFCVTGSNAYYLMNDGKVYVSGGNAAAGIGKEAGDVDNIVCVNDLINIPLIDSFLFSRVTGDSNILLLKGEDGNLYGTGNKTIMFGENILQKSWKKIASNVKKFNAKTTGNSLAYIDNNNDIWVLGADSNYFGMNRTNGEKIRNFVRLKDYIENTEMYNHINGKVVDYVLGSYSLRILTDSTDNNTIYVSGYYKSSTWYVYNYLGVNDTDDHFSFVKVMDNVKFFDGKDADNFVVTTDNKLYSWGLFDGNGSFKKTLPTEVSLSSSIVINDSTIATNNSHYQKFIISNSKLYNAGYGTISSTTNGMSSGTNGNFTQYPTETFNNENIIDITSCNNASFVVLTESGKLYGCGMYCDLGLNNADSGIKGTISVLYSSKKVVQVVGGNGWFVAVTEDGEVFGTGSNSYGILGRWVGIDRNSPNSRYKTAFHWVECPELEI